MEFLRTATNPWGQGVLVGISWSLMWLALVAGVVFVVGHAVWARRAAARVPAPPPPVPAGVPEQVVRHTAAARAFHWLMAVAMFVLLITAFFPVAGIRFPWVTVHWIAGLALLATVIYHIVHAAFWMDLWSMWISRRDLAEGWDDLKHAMGRGDPPPKPGKYPLDHKLYHHTTALLSLAVIGTGLLMMVRVDTPFWDRNPYLLSDGLWGLVYVVHGLAGVGFITTILAHIYFALRPEKRWMTWSMLHGRIDRAEFLTHHDPQRWHVANGTGRSTDPARAKASPEAAPVESDASAR